MKKNKRVPMRRPSVEAAPSLPEKEETSAVPETALPVAESEFEDEAPVPDNVRKLTSDEIEKASKAELVKSAYDQMPDEIDDTGQVFKMAYLDMRLEATKNKAVAVAQAFDEHVRKLEEDIARVRAQKQTKMQEFQTEIKSLEHQALEQKQYIEEKHHIALRCYTYDDETGILRKQDVLREGGQTNP